MVLIRLGGAALNGSLAVLEHSGRRGHSSPLHVHHADDEAFVVMDGGLRVEVDGQTFAAGLGSAAALPRSRPHSFVVVSNDARFLAIHTPAGFDRFTRAGGIPEIDVAPPAGIAPADPAELSLLAAQYGIEIIGPPPVA